MSRMRFVGNRHDFESPCDGAAIRPTHEEFTMLLRFSALVLALLAPVSASAQAPQPGWIADARTGCKVWADRVEATQTARWTGMCPSGIAEGRGILQWFRNGELNNSIDAEFRDGKPNGRAVVTFANGDRYDGEWRDGRQSGRGVYVARDGYRYEGEWRDGEPNGRGVVTPANGDRYEGELRDGALIGRVIHTYANGDRYEGEFRDANANGHGVFTSANGDRYEGMFRDDGPNGSGTLTKSDGEVFSGNWTDGCFRQGSRKAWVGTTAKRCGFE